MTDSLEEAGTEAVDARLSHLLPDYSVPEGHFDELRATDGTLRPEWNTFASSERDLSTASCAQANQRIARQIDENGVTYNVYATERGSARPWALDVLPMVIPSPEWVTLERGLRQRARLLNSVAADLYGSQSLIRDGLIPPALVFRHSGFLRACHGVRPPNGTYLHVA